MVHVEGEAFPASRNVLAAGSAFFDGIFGSGMRDEHEPEVREMAASAFRPCLGFIYEGSCAVEDVQFWLLTVPARSVISEEIAPVNVNGASCWPRRK